MIKVPILSKIERDFQCICAYLELSNLNLKLNFNSDEGFYDEKHNVVILGIKHGFFRILLIHECLHAFGLNHAKETVGWFESWLMFDEISPAIERTIFGD